jgi:hypothetical protein
MAWFSSVEQRVTGPHIIDIVDLRVRMLEQVRHLIVDLERVSFAQQVRIEPITV